MIKLLIYITNHRKLFWVTIFLIYWIVACGYTLYLGDKLPYPDENWYYHEYGKSIAESGIYSRDGKTPTAYHPPAWPLFIGILRKFGATIPLVRLINFGFLFVSLILVYKIVLRYSVIGAMIAVFLGLAYPLLLSVNRVKNPCL